MPRVALPPGLTPEVSKLRSKTVVLTTCEKIEGVPPQFFDLQTVRRARTV